MNLNCHLPHLFCFRSVHFTSGRYVAPVFEDAARRCPANLFSAIGDSGISELRWPGDRGLLPGLGLPSGFAFRSIFISGSSFRDIFAGVGGCFGLELSSLTVCPFAGESFPVSGVPSPFTLENAFSDSVDTLPVPRDTFPFAGVSFSETSEVRSFARLFVFAAENGGRSGGGSFTTVRSFAGGSCAVGLATWVSLAGGNSVFVE
mmetsp:Transcript_28603/g.39492  ORF Transcript_28603/g.39492 Transcript_28603/m.39492 type:complete len:204 (-) Transcript_28603:1194-1805(-)